MKRKFRIGVFETNSSSIHSICICTEDEYNRWVNEEMVYNDWLDKIVPLEELEKERDENPYVKHIKTYKEWVAYNGIRNLESYKESFTDSNNVKFIVFGHFGTMHY